MRDLVNKLHIVTAIAMTTVNDNTATSSGWLDRQGFSALAFAIQTGQLADADATFAVTVQHADLPDFSDAAPTGDYDLDGSASFTFADDNVIKKLGYIGDKRYIRLSITPANNTGAATFGAVAIFGRAAVAPVA